jgi:hypothetical protein
MPYPPLISIEVHKYDGPQAIYGKWPGRAYLCIKIIYVHNWMLGKYMVINNHVLYTFSEKKSLLVTHIFIDSLYFYYLVFIFIIYCLLCMFNLV